MPDKRIRHLVERVQQRLGQYTSYFPKPEVAAAVGDAAQALYDELIAPKRSPRPMGVATNRKTDRLLHPFLRRANFTALGGSLKPGGLFTLPADFDYVDHYLIGSALVTEEVDGFALSYRLNDPIAGPDAEHPIVALRENNQRQVYPNTLPALTVQAYVRPLTPVYAERQVGNQLEYHDVASVDTGFTAAADQHLITRAVSRLAQTLRDRGMSAEADKLTQTDL
ncbi:hypothetical protein [Hymenobacter koreensis]|uniref:Uncharacterized protein n=1 Tax=Hymenobacter koreensis TaxID=1084523 RepID=A0ABP8JJK2_9BACT